MTKDQKQLLDNLMVITTNTPLKANEHQYFIQGLEHLAQVLGPLEEEPAAEASAEAAPSEAVSEQSL